MARFYKMGELTLLTATLQMEVIIKPMISQCQEAWKPLYRINLNITENPQGSHAMPLIV